ncbi:MAG: bacteriohemerythrin [Methylobacter sp.]|uniref:bacteriohemerythrin n=1 Tax=Methylobacter sp. TaxID=2051955 RepID=UPI002730C2D7|nr:bacteriohemerythrin [Methylobacter sp.]MDP1666787.1 bacteriohemerythrin [Methylobacter sp.]
MAILNWNDQLVLGIESVDNQHKHLIDLTNQLDEAVAIGADRDTIIKIINNLVEYTVYHFQDEEQLMLAAKFNPTLYAVHEAEHKEFVDKMIAVQREVEADINALSEDLMDYLVNWLCHHILSTDKRMALSLINGIDAAQIQIDKQEHHEIIQSNLYSALRESESRFKELAENISALIWITNANHMPIFCNHFWLATFNLPPGIPSREQWLNAIHPEDRDKVTQTYSRAAEERSKFKIQYRLLTVDGKITWIYETAAPRVRKNGSFAGLMGCGMDITSQKQAETVLARSNVQLEEEVKKRTQELIKINQTLEFEKNQQLLLNTQLQEAQVHLLQSEKMASIGQLAAGVAHEINNPIGYINSNLTSLKNYIDNLLALIAIYEKAEATSDNIDQLAQIKAFKQKIDLEFIKTDVLDLLEESHEGATRVKEIIQDLKDFSHLDINDDWQWTNLHVGLESTLNIVNNEIKYKAKIVKEFGDLPEVKCLPHQLNQVFMNLLINAAHAIESEGTITLRTGTENDRAWVEVSDTGKGIAPEHQSKIFDPFFTTKPVGKGTGLGLSVSYTIIKKHQGEIQLTSQLGQGTTFRIILPIGGAIIENA